MPRETNSSKETLRLLSVFLQDPMAWRYGYELSEEVSLKSGTLYPMLRRLHEDGILERKWEVPEKDQGPRRRLYKLSAEGVIFAKANATSEKHQVQRTWKPALGLNT